MEKGDQTKEKDLNRGVEVIYWHGKRGLIEFYKQEIKYLCLHFY